MNIPKRNPSGLPDPTAYDALTNIERKQKKKAINDTPKEAEEQVTLFAWVSWNSKRYPELWFLHHIPNGGSRNGIEAKNLRLQGVKKGVSDLFLPVARKGYHGLYLELKRKTGYELLPEQSEWINRVREQGYAAFFCYGADDAIEKLEWYLKNEL